MLPFQKFGNAILPALALAAFLTFLNSCADTSSAAGKDVPARVRQVQAAWKPESLSNFAELNGTVWRSEQPSPLAFRELEAKGLKSVLNLREFHSDRDEAEKTDLNLYHVRLSAGRITAAQLEQCLAIIRDAPKPLLVHCKHGSDRTGAVCAAYRIVFERWSKDAAVEELRNDGYGFHAFWYPNIPELISGTDFDAMRTRLFPGKEDR